MLGGWVNPHREQQTIPQGQTSLPPKCFSTPTANGQSAPRTGSARGGGRRGEPHTEHGLGVLLNTFHTRTAASMKRDRRKSLLGAQGTFKIKEGAVQRHRLAWPHRRRGLASDGVRYAGARSSVGRRFRSVTKLRLEWYGGIFLLLQ